MDMMMMGTNMFQTTNMALARTYWYIVAAVVGAFVVVRIVNYYDSWVRLRARSSSSREYPTKPMSAFLQTWATLTAVFREMSYPQLYVPLRYFTWLTPPPLGRVLMLLVYWGIIVGFMCAGSIIKDVNFWERIGFRNAWVTVTQLPLLYLLAGKSSVIAMLTGSSHERLNWAHRWIARTMFVTASVHGWHFYNEYAKAGMTSIFFQVMPMGKYGMAAWGLLLWSFVVGMAPLRHLCYEVFVLQHIVTAVVLLWVVYQHVPAYARYNVWFAIAALAFDRVVRFAMLLWQNIKVRSPNRSRCKGGQRIGHEAQIRAVGDDITIVTIKDVHFTWRAGQHLYLWMPWIGPLEQHPFTIACAHQLPDTCICNSIQLVVRKHGGFSKRLHDRAVKLQQAHGPGNGSSSSRASTFTAFVTGPYGEPARWDIYETLVLISASTGASFTLPILESVLQADHNAICTKRIDFLLAAKKGDEIGYYVQRLHELIDKAKTSGIELTVSIAVTQDAKSLPALLRRASDAPARLTAAADDAAPLRENEKGYSSSSSLAATSAVPDEQEPVATSSCCMAKEADVEKSAQVITPAAGPDADADADADAPATVTTRHRPSSVASDDSHVQQMTTRPDIAAFIRNAVETTGGETSVVVCGGKSLVARARNCVAKLSDERAVHKGTDAQGIHLHVEEYGF
ncbi:metalloreductase [Sporothrix schenckii 1099-18]|uniref:ferric-chelate reductase (NADPH) n=1 Tax=Sporothrix schenckii 1099-18 TaxID=1397361 RepID=A0A0F2MJZ8_SPOSC|nr:metalloreductase [Sporothrix schenckii 1099-18]KJR89165.1 metalloreductase [Sporothrix schenckii 1099-18]